MGPAPSGLQEVDGLNHLLGNLRLDRGSVRRCTSQSPRQSRFPNCSRNILSPIGAVPRTASSNAETPPVGWCAVFPFNHCSSRLIVTCGEWRPSNARGPWLRAPSRSGLHEMSRIRSRTRVATSPLKAGRRYFVIQTKCRWISNTVCAPRRYSAIPELILRRAC